MSGPFDRASVMLYRFGGLFYKSQPSPCAPSGNGINLSDGDARALRLLYPRMGGGLDEVVDRSTAMLRVIERETPADLGLEAETPDSAYAADAARILRRRVLALTDSE